MSKSNKTQRPSSSINDQATTVDLLGFEPYVKAVAKFLANPHTKPPLTMSIEGSWGSGKSSFMLQLDEIIRNGGGKTVRFNAWRHDKAEALWAAFALDFIHQLPKQSTFFYRIKGYLRLQWLRFTWRYGWLSKLYIVSMLISTILTFVIIYLLFNDSNFVNYLFNIFFDFLELNDDNKFKQVLNNLIVPSGTVALLGIIFSNLKGIFGNSLNIDLNKYLISPNYESHTDFIRGFHNDFSKVVSAYADQSKVYVFIDDLDRCDVPKSAELMQAINLLIANDPNLIFIIGMDRMKVAAGLATKNEKLLPYLYSLNVSEDCTNRKYQLGLEFGYEFIEKFIQLPFLVPQPEKQNVANLLDKVHNVTTETNQKTFNIPQIMAGVIESIVNIWNKIHMKNQNDSINGSDTHVNKNKMIIESEKSDLDENSSRHKEILTMVSDAFEHNPRRLIQFINVFRLKRDIAKEIGLFQYNKNSLIENRWNYEKLGKFVAITIRWPLLVSDLVSNRVSLSDLQKKALEPSSFSGKKIDKNLIFKYWSNNQNLMKILKYGCFDGEHMQSNKTIEKYSLENLNFDKLLKISPIALPLSMNNYNKNNIPQYYDTNLKNIQNEKLARTYMVENDGNEKTHNFEMPLSEKSAAMEKAVIDLIRKNDKGILQNDLWKELNIDSRKCSRIVKELVSKDQITRESAVHNGARTYLLKYNIKFESIV